ncbi:hypothetical protein ACFFK0_23235 [Paenibacillus chartarius]|uniref:YtzI protein n=1 Tax=Paenibacillus chartarius TaxID=747481 RepID=A0ABV6DRQ2_9BACL
MFLMTFVSACAGIGLYMLLKAPNRPPQTNRDSEEHYAEVTVSYTPAPDFVVRSERTLATSPAQKE